VLRTRSLGTHLLSRPVRLRLKVVPHLSLDLLPHLPPPAKQPPKLPSLEGNQISTSPQKLSELLVAARYRVRNHTHHLILTEKSGDCHRGLIS
jgi:hypothetical protein